MALSHMDALQMWLALSCEGMYYGYNNFITVSCIIGVVSSLNVTLQTEVGQFISPLFMFPSSTDSHICNPVCLAVQEEVFLFSESVFLSTLCQVFSWLDA